MTYDDFKSRFFAALQASGLPTIGTTLDETLDLRSMDRTCSVGVEPIDRTIGEPFHIGAKVSFRWDALQTARTATTEDDMLAELLGRDDARGIETEQPWLRVDIRLHAALLMGEPIPMPSAATWAKWSREAVSRLERIEPLVADEVVRELPEGRLAVLAWQGVPELEVHCDADGRLLLQCIEVHAFQGIDLPRQRDDPERGFDDGPDEQLAAMFARVRAALYAWGEVMDHLVPRKPRG